MVNLGPEAEAAFKAGKFGGKSADEAIALAKTLAKSGDELAAILKDARQEVKFGDEAINAAKSSFKLDEGVAENLLKGAKQEAGAELKLAGKEGEATAEELAAGAKLDAKNIKDSKGFLAKATEKCTGNAKWCAGAVLGSAAAIYAADKYMKIKNYKGKITKIEPGEDGGLPIIGGGTKIAKVTYAEAVDILPTDTISISGTDCSPSIDGDHTPYKIASKTEFWIKFETGLSSPGSKGDFTITTGVVERLGEAVGKGAGTAGAAAGTAAGAAAGGAASGLGQGGSSFLKSFTSGAGLWLTLILCCLCFAFIIFKFIL